MTTRDIIVMGTSAGGLSTLNQILKELPEDLKAAVFIVCHISPYSKSMLPEILSRAGRLTAKHAVDGEAIQHGKIYVAPPDRHLLLESDRVRLTRGPKENRFRPAIDPLFRSAAYSFGPRVVGVVLTGALDDGTAGLWTIKDRGGVGLVQDPAEAEHPSMPLSAVNNVDVDYCVPVAEIPNLLIKLTLEPIPETGGVPVSKDLEIETKIALGEDAGDIDLTQIGKVSAFTCPECHGNLIEITNGNLHRFRCHTGHSFGSASLVAELTESIEESLWTTIRAAAERIRLLKHFFQQAVDLNHPELIASLSRELQEAEKRADLLRQAAMLDMSKKSG